jgi:hypothetical protein
VSEEQHFTYKINDGNCDPSIRIDEHQLPYFWVDIEAVHQLIDTLNEALRVYHDPEGRNYTPTEGNTDGRVVTARPAQTDG